jgi:outer membrane protein assembly factor BamB
MRFSALSNHLALAGLAVLSAALWSCHDATGLGPPGVRGRWYQPQSGWARARPAVFGNVVYFGDGYGELIARDVRTGDRKWTTRVGQDPINGANILVRAGVVVAPLYIYTVGVDAVTGRELWRFKAPDDTVGIPRGYIALPGSVDASSIDADDQTVYIPAWGASVSAVDIHTGKARWMWQPGRIDGDTATSGVFRSGSMGVRVSGDTIFATMWHAVNRSGGYSEAWLVALDRLMGKELWRVRLPYEGSGVLVWAAPVVYQNLVIVHTISARTYAIDRTTQEVVWEFTVPSAHLSTLAGAELFEDVLPLIRFFPRPPRSRMGLCSSQLQTQRFALMNRSLHAHPILFRCDRLTTRSAARPAGSSMIRSRRSTSRLPLLLHSCAGGT